MGCTRKSGLLWAVVFALVFGCVAEAQQSQTTNQSKKATPRVFVLGVNGMELDIIRPLLLEGKMPNLARVIKNGAYGKLRTLAAPNCPKVYTAIETSTPPEENGITGFLVGGITANTDMLKKEPLWSILSKKGVTVGMANVPATFPAMPVNGYVVTGMLTRGKGGCEDGVLCSPKLSQVEGGDAVYPRTLATELEKNIGDFNIDCSRMPSAEELKGKEAEVVHQWLAKVDDIRAQQYKLFDYLLTHHPTQFTFMAQSCEDRVGHWLYPIQPFNAGYNPKINSVEVDAFPRQYMALDKFLGMILSHLDDQTYLFIISDHGIKPLREFEETDPHAHMDHEKTTPVIAKHDFGDGDDVPGSFFAMGPGIKKDYRLMGLPISVYDIAPTILHLYGIDALPDMRGHVITDIFEGGKIPTNTASAKRPE